MRLSFAAVIIGIFVLFAPHAVFAKEKGAGKAAVKEACKTEARQTYAGTGDKEQRKEQQKAYLKDCMRRNRAA